MTVEKKLVKEKEELLSVLPIVAPLKAIQVQIDELFARKKVLAPVLKAAFEKFSAVRLEFTGLVEGLDEIRNANISDKEKTDPLFGTLRAEFDAKIEALKESKKTTRDQYKVTRDKYEDQ